MKAKINYEYTMNELFEMFCQGINKANVEFYGSEVEYEKSGAKSLYVPMSRYSNESEWMSDDEKQSIKGQGLTFADMYLELRHKHEIKERCLKYVVQCLEIYNFDEIQCYDENGQNILEQLILNAKSKG